MMKRMILGLAMLASAVGMQAQYQKGDTFFYPRIGFSVANMTGNDILVTAEETANNTLKSKGKSGFTVGGEIERFVSTPLSLSAGLFYSNVGCRFEDYGNEDKRAGTFENMEDNKWNVNQLSVPVMVNFYVTERVALKVGAEWSYTTEAKAHYTFTEGHISDGINYVTDKQEEHTDNMDKTSHKMGLSFPVGASIEYKRVVLDARYHLGLTKATKLYDSRHRWFSLTLGYQLEL